MISIGDVSIPSTFNSQNRLSRTSDGNVGEKTFSNRGVHGGAGTTPSNGR